MKSIFGVLNSFIPFADPSKPLWHDVVYSIFLCTFLYFAPQLPFDRIWQSTRTRARERQDVTQEPTLDGLYDDIDDELLDDTELLQHNLQRLEGHPPRPFPTVEDEIDDEDIPAFQPFEPEFPILDNGFAPEPAGPPNAAAAPNQPRRLRDPNRPVGAKKAKSIARRDRMRAYNEFLREQGDMQRAQDASTAEQREKELQEEKQRRAKVEAEIEQRERKKREERKQREEQARREEAEMISSTLTLVTESLRTKGMIDIVEVSKSIGRDTKWVESHLRKEGIFGMANKSGTKTLTMLTSRGWVVQVSEDAIRQLYKDAAMYQGTTPGKVTWPEMGTLLGQILQQRHAVGPI